jgi:hypothetical protein
MRRSRLILLSLALAGLCPEASAEWILTIYTGLSFSTDSTLHVSQSSSHSDASFESVSWTGHPFGHGAPYYGVSVSYSPPAHDQLAAMVDFTHYKMYAETADQVAVHGTWNGLPVDARAPLGAFVHNLEIAHGVNLASLNGEYRWNPRFADGRWQIQAGAGVGAFVPHSDGDVDGAAVDGNYQYGGLGWQVFGGAEYALPRGLVPWRTPSSRIGVLVESKFDSGTLNLNLNPDTRVETHTATFHVIGGVALHL